MESIKSPTQRAAERLLAWASNQGLFQGEAAEAASCCVDDSGFPGEGEDQVASMLHSRGITFVGYCNETETTYLYTKKKPTRKDSNFIQKAFEGTAVSVECRQGDFAAVKGEPPTPVSINPGECYKDRYTCGSSVHVVRPIGAGTMGALVTDNESIFGLTSNHVSGMCSYAEEGLPILAPGSVDIKPGSIDPFTIGHHFSTLPMVGGTPNNVDVAKNTDAALFKIADPDRVTSMQRRHYDTPKSFATIQTAMQVEKVGRTTGLTHGVVESQAAGPMPIQYSNPAQRHVFYENVFVVRSVETEGVFATAGDSGALVTSLSPNGERYAVGIVLGASSSNKLVYVLPLAPILEQFGVSLLCNHNAQ